MLRQHAASEGPQEGGIVCPQPEMGLFSEQKGLISGGLALGAVQPEVEWEPQRWEKVWLKGIHHLDEKKWVFELPTIGSLVLDLKS